jgi:DNA polymerase
VISVVVEPSFESFRQHSRQLLGAGVPPQEIQWSNIDDPQLPLLPTELLPKSSASTPTVPRGYVELARIVVCHSDPSRWTLLYSVLWRITHGEHHLLSLKIDPEVLRLNEMRQDIARDVHHMHAFVRFRRVTVGNDEWFIAWHRPDHRVLRLAAPFFAERFASMRWAILTPDESVRWDLKELAFGPGVPQSEAPTEDDLESLWSTYYRTTFNPARMNLDLMRQEMPSRFWDNLPELRDLPGIVTDAPARLDRMQRLQQTSALPLVPASRDLVVLRDAASQCTGCSLHCDATQTVFGEGPSTASIVLIGEQPGDMEDQRGRPFVGPAGDVLDRALAEAGIARDSIYMTNAVKHFKFVRQGKRRIHQTPRITEVMACKPWLEAELDSIRPKGIVLLGATAAKSLLGSSARITRDAGKVLATRHAEHTVISVHPSFVLRSQDEEQSRAVFQRLIADLTTIRKLVG